MWRKVELNLVDKTAFSYLEKKLLELQELVIESEKTKLESLVSLVIHLKDAKCLGKEKI